MKETNLLDSIYNLGDEEDGNRLNPIPLDALYYNLLQHEEAINLTGNNSISLVKKRIVLHKTGIYSSDLGDAYIKEDVRRKYSCTCGKLYGKIRLGTNQICDECYTAVVENSDVGLDKLGWIDLKDNFIIEFWAYKLIENIISQKVLKEILNYIPILDINAIAKVLTKEEMRQNGYRNIGLKNFKEYFLEILDFYFGKLKEVSVKKQQAYDLLRKFKNRIFCSKIPVFSIKLRPLFITNNSKNLSYIGLNHYYQKLLIYSNSLTSKSIEIHGRDLIILNNIQEEYINLTNLIIMDKFSGKRKTVRLNIFGANINYTARVVIVPSEHEFNDLDSVQMNYLSFITIYDTLLMSCLMKGIIVDKYQHRSLYYIKQLIEFAKYDEYVNPDLLKISETLIYERMRRGQPLSVLMNRNPSLDFGSIQMVNINGLIYDPKTKRYPLVNGISTGSVKEFNADFDGDQLAFMAILMRQHWELFKAISPSNFSIDRKSNRNYNPNYATHSELTSILYKFINDNKENSLNGSFIDAKQEIIKKKER